MNKKIIGKKYYAFLSTYYTLYITYYTVFLGSAFLTDSTRDLRSL